MPEIFGTSDNDTLKGGGGNDTIYGDLGDDIIYSFEGNDEVFGDQDNDQIYLGPGQDQGNGWSGNDYISGEGGADTLSGGDGNDTLNGGPEADRFFGNGGSDTVDYAGSPAGVTIRLNGFGASFQISAAIPLLSIPEVRGIVIGAGGDAEGDVAAWSASVFSTIGVENVTGSGLADFLFGNGNPNVLRGANGKDYLWGGGSSTLIDAPPFGGGPDADTLYGDAGDDTLVGGRAADMLDGGADFDVASYLESSSGITARLDFPSLNTGEAAGDSYTSIEGLIGSQFSDFLLVGDGQANYIAALGGDDYAAGEAGDDTILGGEGNDQFWGGTGSDYIDGSTGFDIARYDFAASGVVARLDGGANAGEAAGDTYANIEALYGSAFGDYLIGDSAGNVLAGLGGADLLYGLGGNDILLGGGGADAFAFNTAGFGTDTVQDFATTAAAGANHDYVDFRGIPALSSFVITQVGADTHVVTNHGTVILQGITASTLVAGDFLF